MGGDFSRAVVHLQFITSCLSFQVQNSPNFGAYSGSLPLLTFASGNVETSDSYAVFGALDTTLPLAQKYTLIFRGKVALQDACATFTGYIIIYMGISKNSGKEH